MTSTIKEKKMTFSDLHHPFACLLHLCYILCGLGCQTRDPKHHSVRARVAFARRKILHFGVLLRQCTRCKCMSSTCREVKSTACIWQPFRRIESELIEVSLPMKIKADFYMSPERILILLDVNCALCGWF